MFRGRLEEIVELKIKILIFDSTYFFEPPTPKSTDLFSKFFLKEFEVCICSKGKEETLNRFIFT
jgi:hypothetical protein